MTVAVTGRSYGGQTNLRSHGGWGAGIFAIATALPKNYPHSTSQTGPLPWGLFGALRCSARLKSQRVSLGPDYVMRISIVPSSEIPVTFHLTGWTASLRMDAAPQTRPRGAVIQGKEIKGEIPQCPPNDNIPRWASCAAHIPS